MSTRPAGPHLSTRLRSLALTSPPTTALFYARLYYALFNSEEHDSAHILALTLLQAGQAYPALHIVRETAEPPSGTSGSTGRGVGSTGHDGCYGCALIVAKCCNALSRFTEGRDVLSRATERARRTGPMMSIPTPCPAETSATASLMLARFSYKSKISDSASEHYTRALSEDPWLWEAFTGLCEIGTSVNPDTIFSDPVSSMKSTSTTTSRHATLSPSLGLGPGHGHGLNSNLARRRQMSPLAGPSSNGFFTPEVSAGTAGVDMLGDPASWDASSVIGDTTFGGPDQSTIGITTRRPLPSLISSLLPSSSSSSSSSSRPFTTPDAQSKPPAMKRPRGGLPTRRAENSPSHSGNNGSDISNGHSIVHLPLGKDTQTNGKEIVASEINEKDGSMRRSTRHTAVIPGGKLAAPRAAAAAREKRNTRSRSATSSTSGQTAETTSLATAEAAAQAVADDWLRDVVRKCARAYAALMSYKCQEALAELDTLPVEIQLSPWALDIAARSFYEMANYILAQRAFRALLDAEPYRLEGTEHYSTTLWHLGESAALSHLSQTLLSISRESPQAWIATGNTFSLLREHEEAMKCFRRASQLDPGCAYAWTLAGYEAIEMEEYERALGMFRTAIRNDKRHYNAWYGIGLVYLRTGKLKHADHHFQRASEINPTNAVLLCCIGDVREQCQDYMSALEIYEKACLHAPNSAMVKFKRARVLVSLDLIPRAIEELEPLSRDAPDEANIFFLLGKCYLRVGRNADATIALTTAQELQPKLERAIRATLLAKGEGEEEEEEEEEEGA